MEQSAGHDGWARFVHAQARPELARRRRPHKNRPMSGGSASGILPWQAAPWRTAPWRAYLIAATSSRARSRLLPLRLSRQLSSDNRLCPPKRRYAAWECRPSAGIERVLLEDGRGRRRSDEAHQRLGRINFLRPGWNSGRKHGDQLNIRRQRPDVVDARKEAELAHLLEADLGFAAGDDAADEDAGR